MKASEVKTGNFVKYNEHIHLIIKNEFYQSDSNKNSVNLNMFNLDTGETALNSLSTEEVIERIDLPHNEMRLIYKSENSLIFSDEDNNEQVEIKTSIIGEKASFLHDKSTMEVFYYKDMIVSVELPKIVVFSIDHTEDIEKDSSNLNYIKEAKISNGHTINVPAFIKIGDRVRINTETGEYICRD